MLAAGVVGASMGFFEGITQKCLIWVTEGSYENYMLNRYNKFQDETKLYVDKKKEENKELIGKYGCGISGIMKIRVITISLRILIFYPLRY